MYASRCYLIIELLDRVAYLQQLLILFIHRITMNARSASELIQIHFNFWCIRAKISPPQIWRALIREILEESSIFPHQNSVYIFQIDYIEIAMDIISEYVSFSHFRIQSAVQSSAFIIPEFPKIATEVAQCVGQHMCSRTDRWNCVRIEY